MEDTNTTQCTCQAIGLILKKTTKNPPLSFRKRKNLDGLFLNQEVVGTKYRYCSSDVTSEQVSITLGVTLYN